MDDSMIERVQNAICQKVFDLTGTMIVNTGDQLARAAIEAMRSGNSETRAALALHRYRRGSGDDLWAAAIDAVLTPPDSTNPSA